MNGATAKLAVTCVKAITCFQKSIITTKVRQPRGSYVHSAQPLAACPLKADMPILEWLTILRMGSWYFKACLDDNYVVNLDLTICQQL
jgi:hypothetical protein